MIEFGLKLITFRIQMHTAFFDKSTEDMKVWVRKGKKKKKDSDLRRKIFLHLNQT